jgi:hypothetical protein
MGTEVGQEKKTSEVVHPLYGTTVTEALMMARNLKYGPLPVPGSPIPSIEEAITLINAERRICGFNWITGRAAEETLRLAQGETKPS